MNKKITVSELSIITTRISSLDMIYGNFSNASGFFYFFNEKVYLITNWHVVTGINPWNLKPMYTKGTSPQSLFIGTRDPHNFIVVHPATVPLYLDKEYTQPAFLVHPKFNSKVDVVAIDLDFKKDSGFLSNFPAINRPFELSIAKKLSAGQNIRIIGYPDPENIKSHFPIWKTGFLASEPEVDLFELPMFYIDSTTKQGMSGSIITSVGQKMINDGNNIGVGEGNFLVGVYSGRINPKLAEMDIGIGYHFSVVDEIIIGGKYGDINFVKASNAIMKQD